MELAAIIFVFVTLGIGYVVFRVLKKTLKLLIRAIILIIIIAVAFIGGLALWTAGTDAATQIISTLTR